MLKVLIEGFTEYDNIIQIYQGMRGADSGGDYLLHEPLESRGTIVKTHRHAGIFVQAIGANESRLFLVFFSNRYLPKTGYEVEDGEPLRFS